MTGDQQPGETGVPRGGGRARGRRWPSSASRGPRSASTASRRRGGWRRRRSRSRATVEVDGDEIGSGRFVLLYDPAGQDGWAGPFRVIAYLRAELEPEIAADPLIGQVGWSWLTEALDAQARRLRGTKRYGDQGGHRRVRHQAGRAGRRPSSRCGHPGRRSSDDSAAGSSSTGTSRPGPTRCAWRAACRRCRPASPSSGRPRRTSPGRGAGRECPAARAPRRAAAADRAPPTALAEATARLRAGTGPVAVDAERASGFRYGHRAFLVQLRRRRRRHRADRPGRLPGPVRRRRGAGRHRGGAARGRPGPALPDRSRLPAAASVRHRTGRAAARLSEGRPRHPGRGGARPDPGEDAIRPPTGRPGRCRQEWLKYAALDVEVLVELRDALAAQLAEQGKTSWAEQEFAAVLAAKPAPPRPDPWRRTSGIHRVRSRRSLAIVRELWQERDRIAQRRDISPTRILPDAAIVEAARTAPAHHGGTRQAAPASPGAAPAGTALTGCARSGGPRRWPTTSCRTPRPRQATARRPRTAGPSATRSRPSGWRPPGPPWPRWPTPATCRPRTCSRRTRCGGCPGSRPTRSARSRSPPNSSATARRPWQIEVTAMPIAMALLRLIEKGEA